MTGNRTVYDQAMQTGAAHTAQQRWQEAIAAFQQAAAEFPHDINAHVNLLKIYLAQRRTDEAVHEYAILIAIYQANGQIEQALQICQHALKLEPLNPQILALQAQLRGEEPPPPPEPASFSYAEESEMFAEDELLTEEGESRGSLVETARQKALADLAEAIFDEALPKTGPLVLKPLSKREVDGLISKALDAQTRGNVEEAIRSYEQILKAGVVQPAANFNLGLLYQQQLRFEDALAQFKQSVEEPEYRLGSHFALGECYRALGQIEHARLHFIEVLKIVDLGTVRREQADDLIQLYEELAHTHAAAGEGDQAVEFVNSLIAFLNDKGWEDKVIDARERLDTLTSEGPVLSLAEVLAIPGSQRILQMIGLAQQYERHGKLYAAIEELSRAISLAPSLLPIHWQMGETLVAMGKVDKAVAKFLTIGDVYRVRGNFSLGMAMYERALRLDPMNLNVRTKLIDVLISHGQIDRALDHYMVLGNTYYQMAQTDMAREKYNQALQLSPRGSPDRNWAVRFLHRMADIDMQRVDWRRATGVYEKIRDLAPDDEKARLTLMDLYFRFNQDGRAIAELDNLLQIYQKTGKMPKAITILQEQVQERPSNIPLRTRLAQALLDTRNVQEAIAQLDALGDLQLEAGQTKEAITTIKVILRLNPSNPEPYQQLLQELAGS